MATLTRQKPVGQSLSVTLKGTRADRVLLALALLLIATAWWVIQAVMLSGPAVAMIYHGSTLLASYPLPGPGEPAIHVTAGGELGDSEVIIDQQGARISASPCVTQLCVLSGAHRHAGDIIACVPNHILVTIQGSEDSSYDAIVE
ncbi:hypothetical protein FE236_04325 [Mariprofundus erugo]|uniref:Uncharacterized protein n=1 Tax=Mariprofundus erugo TaxID=2528639 RepID=A0A5R9GRM7_9PROT|nr:NusG domain II-containing protein [Mariprofundus erugo]TLS66937.1 hypothetical protein FEF65_08195 [Mariprofundus erugo]TLS77363.1 hypothetical protein FE236_04325 [Mariprofundus erugo]